MLKLIEIQDSGEFRRYTISQSADGRVGIYSEENHPLILMTPENAAFIGQQLIAMALTVNKAQLSNINKSIRKVSL